MRINDLLLSELSKNCNQITTKRVLELGFSRQILSMYVKENLLVRVRQGLYILTDSIHDEMYTLSQRSENIVFSHESALFLNDLSDRTPFIHTVTFPTGATVPHSIRDEVQTFFVKPILFEVGLTKRKTMFGNTVKCYDVERTICDLLRSRRRFDTETIVNAIKNYVGWKKKKVVQLFKYARLFKIEQIVRNYMEVLL